MATIGHCPSSANDAPPLSDAAPVPAPFPFFNDAALYLRDGDQTLSARGATAFDVAEIPGAIGFTDATEGSGGSFTTHAVAFTSGVRWVLAIVGSRGTGRTPDDARAVALAQATHLSTPPG